MGTVIDPSRLTRSGENCLRRIDQLASLRLPVEHFVTAMTAPVEAHVSRVISHLVRDSDMDRSALGRALLEEVESEMTQNWPNRTGWLARGFDIHVAGDLAWQRFDTVIQARNALVHGDGQLSDQQKALALTKLIQLKKRLRDEMNVGWSRGRLAFDATSGAAAHDAARRFVADLDARIQATYPQVRGL